MKKNKFNFFGINESQTFTREDIQRLVKNQPTRHLDESQTFIREDIQRLEDHKRKTTTQQNSGVTPNSQVTNPKSVEGKLNQQEHLRN